MDYKQFEHDNLFKIVYKQNGENYSLLKKVKGFNDVYKHYCKFANSVKTAYLEQATDYVMKNLKIITERDNIKTACFYASHLLRQEKEEAYKQKMIKDGWFELTNEIVKKAVEEKKKIEIKAIRTSDWLIVDMSNIYRPFIDDEGQAFLMKPRAKSRGFLLNSFEKGFCKLINN